CIESRSRRSPTTTSAPMSRNTCARSSSLRTIARTTLPCSNSSSVTVRPTAPTRPAAPVTRIGVVISFLLQHLSSALFPPTSFCCRQYRSRRGTLSPPQQFLRRVSRLRNDLYLATGPLRSASLFEMPQPLLEQRTDHSFPRLQAAADSTYENIPEISDIEQHSMRNQETNRAEYLCFPDVQEAPHLMCTTRGERFLDRLHRACTAFVFLPASECSVGSL